MGRSGFSSAARWSSGSAVARVVAPHVLHAEEEVALGALAAAEQAVDHGLPALRLVAADERRAEEVREEPVVAELRLARREQLDHPGVVAQLELAVREQQQGRASATGRGRAPAGTPRPPPRRGPPCRARGRG